MADSSPNSTLDDFLPSRIYLIDQWQPLVDEWSKAFAVFPEITPLVGGYFQQAADAIVSPATASGSWTAGSISPSATSLAMPCRPAFRR